MPRVKLMVQPLGKCGFRYWFYCPGCFHCHGFTVGPDTAWQFNGDVNRPTLTPSYLIPHREQGGGVFTRQCHFNLTDGVVIYHNDCEHGFRNRQHPLPDVEHV
jgi:hypothetical protein